MSGEPEYPLHREPIIKLVDPGPYADYQLMVCPIRGCACPNIHVTRAEETTIQSDFSIALSAYCEWGHHFSIYLTEHEGDTMVTLARLPDDPEDVIVVVEEP
jgi:hypothetical protein